MDRSERLRTADALIARARRRTEELANVTPSASTPDPEVRYPQVMFEQGRITGLIEAANLVLGSEL